MARPRAIRSGDPANLKYLWDSYRLSVMALEAFVRQIQLDDVREMIKADDRLFAEIVDLAVGQYGVTQARIAEELGISGAAVGRWAKAIHLPPPYVRQAVIDVIVELIEPNLVAQKKKMEQRKHAKDISLRGRVTN